MAGYQVAPGSSEFALVSKGWGWGLSCMDSSGQCRHQDCCEVFFLAFGLLSVSKKEGPDATRLTMPLFSVPLAQWLERWSYEP